MIKFIMSFVLSKEVKGNFEQLRLQDLACNNPHLHLLAEMNLTQIQPFTELPEQLWVLKIREYTNIPAQKRNSYYCNRSLCSVHRSEKN